MSVSHTFMNSVWPWRFTLISNMCHVIEMQFLKNLFINLGGNRWLLESDWASTSTVQSHPNIIFVYNPLKYVHGVQVTSFWNGTSFFNPYLTPGIKITIQKPYCISTRYTQSYYLSTIWNVDGVQVTGLIWQKTFLDPQYDPRGQNVYSESLLHICKTYSIIS